MLLDELLTTGGPFPQRLHLTERAASLYGEFVLLLIRWCDETLAEVETWPDTTDIGLTPRARQRLEQLLARARQDTDAARPLRPSGTSRRSSTLALLRQGRCENRWDDVDDAQVHTPT
jgi:hypothetical protein